MAIAAESPTNTHKTAWWRDERKRGLISQIAVVVIVLVVAFYLGQNMVENQRRLGVPLSLDFIDSIAGFQLSFAAIPVTLDSPIGRLLVVGALNTLFAAAICAVLATLLGLMIGVMRLSRNFLIARIAGGYIEVIRNIPLLLQLVFWYTAVVKLLPAMNESLNLFDAVYLNKKGFFAPAPVLGEGSVWIFVALALAILATVLIRHWAQRRQELTGQQFPVFATGCLLILGLPVLASFALGNPVDWAIPEKSGFSFKGGFAMQPELTALVVGLSISSSAFIAEIVRAGILSVSHGQTEAALAIGLKPSWTLRLVIIPQALRVAVPPMISQYLNVVKNSTLAGFIGFPDLFSIIGTSQNQTGRAVECIAIMMAFYLTVSLVISAIMNVYNKRVMLVER